MPRGLLAVVDALLLIQYSTHAVLIVAGLAWFAAGLGFEPYRDGNVPAAVLAILSVSTAWQSVRLFTHSLTNRTGAQKSRPVPKLAPSPRRPVAQPVRKPGADEAFARDDVPPADAIRQGNGRVASVAERTASERTM